MKKNLFFFLAFVFPLFLIAQIEEIEMKNPPDPPPVIDNPSDLMPVDKSASCPGGEGEMMNFI